MPHRLASRLSDRLGDRAIRQHHGLIALAGLGLIALGVAAFGTTAVSARVSVRLAGAVLLAAGVFQAAVALVGPRGRGRPKSLAVGLANMAAGGGFLAATHLGIVVLSLGLAVAQVGAGLYRAVTAYRERGAHWRWMVALGALLVASGVLIGAGWPASGIEAIGRFVGVNLIAEGVTWLWIVRRARAPRVTLAPEAPRRHPAPK